MITAWQSQEAVGSGGTWPGALGHSKVPASRLPQAAGLARVAKHQERFMTRKVASQTDDMYNSIAIFIHMHILCYMDIHHIHNTIMTRQILSYAYIYIYIYKDLFLHPCIRAQCRSCS